MSVSSVRERREEGTLAFLYSLAALW